MTYRLLDAHDWINIGFQEFDPNNRHVIFGILATVGSILTRADGSIRSFHHPELK